MTRIFAFLLILAGIFVGQSFAQLLPATPVAVTAPATATPVTSPVGAASITNGYVPDDVYKLRVGDTISFQIVEDRVLKLQLAPTSLVVADSGEVDVPYIGRVMAVDKTSKRLGEEIKQALEKDYYKKVTVVLSLNAANQLLGRVYIWGQVHNQGAVDLLAKEELTVGKAILRAGGFADFADKRNVKVVRANPDGNGKKQSFDLDMVSILEKGNIDLDLVLQPNDLIIVPSRLINF